MNPIMYPCMKVNRNQEIAFTNTALLWQTVAPNVGFATNVEDSMDKREDTEDDKNWWKLGKLKWGSLCMEVQEDNKLRYRKCKDYDYKQIFVMEKI